MSFDIDDEGVEEGSLFLMRLWSLIIVMVLFEVGVVDVFIVLV